MKFEGDNMYKIRKYQMKDYEGVQKVCIGVADKVWQDKQMFRKALINVYCLYYIEQEPENCFVVVDDNDLVKGYILCAKDYPTYARKFPKLYLKTLNPVTIMVGRASMKAMKDYASDYPAHLHIDLLAECQHQGIGRRLIETLMNHLAKQNVRGLMLDVAQNNEGAQKFYEKCGFKVLHTDKHEILMGMKGEKS
jgi:ribosomal protein S18 acetylase RimI-like enzyme